ncbi:MAG: DNA replication and repair protein RecF [Actinomycetota bacterium]
MEVLRLQDLRNYVLAEFRPAPGTTLVIGDNGSGKSSLLEAAGMFSTLSSPRASSMRFLVREGSDGGAAKLTTTDGASLEVHIRSGRTSMRLNGSPAQAKDFLGRFRSVLFTPEDLDLVRGEPALRRRALDDLLVQMRPGFRAVRQEFERALKQRNAALREGLQMQASLYSEPLAHSAALVLEARRDVASKLDPEAAKLYHELAEHGTLNLRYHDTSESGGRSGAELTSFLADVFSASLHRDLERGRTTISPHRDDLEVFLDGREIRWYASRGEQRSATLAFRLSELKLLPEAVLLLDDVLSELDPERRRRVFEVTAGRQTIVTATDIDSVPPAAKTESTWRVENGSLEEAA